MNEKLQYASMLEMPISTASITYKPAKKKRKKLFSSKVDSERVKKQLIDKVNADEPAELEQVDNLTVQDNSQERDCVPSEEMSMEEVQYAEQVGLTEETVVDAVNVVDEELSPTELTATVKQKPKAKRLANFKISVIGIQFVIIGVLMATIFLTSALNSNSGVNVFLRGVFGVEQTASIDNRTHLDFKPVINADGRDVYMENGVMTFSGNGSVYAPCDGEVLCCESEGNGKYTITVKHSEKFSSVLTGLDYVYTSVGDKVRGNVPVGYSYGDGATMCFTGLDGSIIAGYQIIDNSVVWAV